MALVKTIGPDKSYIDYYQGISTSRRGLQNCFGIRVKEDHCCAVVKVGDAEPFAFGNHYPLPVKFDTLASPIRNTLENHLMNYPASDLGEVLSRKKSFQEALDSTNQANDCNRQSEVCFISMLDRARIAQRKF